MKEECPHLDVIVLRPGLVYSNVLRPWSVPMGLASTIGSKLTGQFGCDALKMPAGTSLTSLGDFTLKELNSNL